MFTLCTLFWEFAQVVSFPGEPVTLHITPLDDVGDETYGLVYLVVEEGRHTDVSCHFIGSCNLIH